MAAEAKLEQAGGDSVVAAGDEVNVVLKWMYASHPRKPKIPRQQLVTIPLSISLAEFASKARDVMGKNEPVDHWTRVGFVSKTADYKRIWEPIKSDEKMREVLRQGKAAGGELHLDLFPAHYNDEEIRKVPVH